MLDFDNDNDLDLVLIDEIADVVLLMQNSGAIDPPAIPTVSAWGLMILTLLLLTTGTIVIARRRMVV